jgi:hypothetical protein
LEDIVEPIEVDGCLGSANVRHEPVVARYDGYHPVLVENDAARDPGVTDDDPHRAPK